LPALQRLERRTATARGHERGPLAGASGPRAKTSAHRPRGDRFASGSRQRGFARGARGAASPEARVAARLRDYLIRRGCSGSVATRVAREVTGVLDGTEADAE